MIAVVCLVLVAVVLAANAVWPDQVNRRFDRLTRPLIDLLDPRLHATRYQLAFCVVCAAFALTIGLLMTQSGSGISPDSTDYVITGENVYLGDGFTSIHGDSYTYGGPLYPLSIAALMVVGLEAEQAAGWIPIVSFALLMFPLFFLGKRLGSAYTGYLACVFCLISAPLLGFTSYIWTEIPYILLAVVAVLLLTRLAQSTTAGTGKLLLAALFVSLAMLMRYVGVSLLAVGAVVVLVRGRFREGPRPRLKWAVGPAFLVVGVVLAVLAVVITPDFVTSHFTVAGSLFERTVRQIQIARVLAAGAGAAAIFAGVLSLTRPSWTKQFLDRVYPAVILGAVAGLPLVLWLIRSTLGTKKFLGYPFSESSTGLLDAFDVALDTIAGDLYPSSTSGVLSYPGLSEYAVLGALGAVFALLTAYLAGHPGRRKSLLEYWRLNYVVILYIVAYLAFVFIVRTLWFEGVRVRYVQVVYPFVALAAISYAIHVAGQMRGHKLRPALSVAAITMCVLLIAIQASAALESYNTAREGQGFNDPFWRDNEGIAWVAENVPSTSPVYTNAPSVLAYRLRKPWLKVAGSGRDDSIEAFFRELQDEENAFVLSSESFRMRKTRLFWHIGNMSAELDLVFRWPRR